MGFRDVGKAQWGSNVTVMHVRRPPQGLLRNALIVWWNILIHDKLSVMSDFI